MHDVLPTPPEHPVEHHLQPQSHPLILAALGPRLAVTLSWGVTLLKDTVAASMQNGTTHSHHVIVGRHINEGRFNKGWL